MIREAKPTRPATFRLDLEDDAILDRIATLLARDGSAPSRTRALRWALRELDARLDLASMPRGSAPVLAAPGPLVLPPA